jgi:hypothetical protein
LKNVEVHAQATPLRDWIGRPTDVLANVIVRRKELGAASDDIGFVRNANGTFDLVLSDIHLFKFDRKWLAELARRTGTLSIAAGPVQYATANTSYANPTHSKPHTASEPREQNLDAHARIESVALLDRSKKSQSLGALGCSLFFLPLLPWLLLQQSEATATGAQGLLVMMGLWSMVYFVVVALVVTIRVRNVARDFHKRFPSREARAAAITHLKAIANDKKHAASEAAKKFIAEVERQGAGVVMPLPKSSNRGPSDSAH